MTLVLNYCNKMRMTNEITVNKNKSLISILKLFEAFLNKTIDIPSV